LKHLFLAAIVLCATSESAAAIDVKRADVKEFVIQETPIAQIAESGAEPTGHHRRDGPAR
jgi:hypothetical protein